MRKVVVGAMVSMDGVMQAPGGPEEDPTGGFKFGGWVAPLADVDPVFGAEIGKLFGEPFDLLLAGAPMTSSRRIGPMPKAARTTTSPERSTGSRNTWRRARALTSRGKVPWRCATRRRMSRS